MYIYYINVTGIYDIVSSILILYSIVAPCPRGVFKAQFLRHLPIAPRDPLVSGSRLTSTVIKGTSPNIYQM